MKRFKRTDVPNTELINEIRNFNNSYEQLARIKILVVDALFNELWLALCLNKSREDLEDVNDVIKTKIIELCPSANITDLARSFYRMTNLDDIHGLFTKRLIEEVPACDSYDTIWYIYRETDSGAKEKEAAKHRLLQLMPAATFQNCQDVLKYAPSCIVLRDAAVKRLKNIILQYSMALALSVYLEASANDSYAKSFALERLGGVFKNELDTHELEKLYFDKQFDYKINNLVAEALFEKINQLRIEVLLSIYDAEPEKSTLKQACLDKINEKASRFSLAGLWNIYSSNCADDRLRDILKPIIDKKIE